MTARPWWWSGSSRHAQRAAVNIALPAWRTVPGRWSRFRVGACTRGAPRGPVQECPVGDRGAPCVGGETVSPLSQQRPPILRKARQGFAGDTDKPNRFHVSDYTNSRIRDKHNLYDGLDASYNGGRWCENNLTSMLLPRCHAKPTGACASPRSCIPGIPGSRWSGSWA